MRTNEEFKAVYWKIPLYECYHYAKTIKLCTCTVLSLETFPGAQESIPPAYVAWRDGTSNRVVVPACQAGNRFLGTLKRFKNSGSVVM